MTEGLSPLIKETLVEIRANISDALVAYDQQSLTDWNFAPITPLVDCP